MTFATSPVSARCFGAISNWLLFLTVVLWAECIIGYNCAVITRRDVNDIVEKSSEKTADEDKEVSVEAIKEPAKQSEYMNCFPATSCYEDCTERLKGNLHIDRDCQALGAEYGFFPTFVCQCHFEEVAHEEEDDEGSNELPIFPPRFYKSNSNDPKSKRNSNFFVSND